MKIFKTFIICFALFTYSKSNSQIPDPKAANKMEWMDTNRDGFINLEEMKFFFKDKKDKHGNLRDAELMFLGYDKNNDNNVDVEEIRTGINWILAEKKRKGDKITTSSSTNYKQKDTQKREKVVPITKNIEDMTLEEFKASFKNSKNAIKGNAKKDLADQKQFNLRDLDRNGFIDIEEMRSFYLGKKHRGGNPIVAAKMFIGYDKDGDKKVIINEFKSGINWKIIRKHEEMHGKIIE